MSDGRMNGEFELFQVGLNASDLAASLRFYAEIFGFANAGGQAGWGPGMALQGLEAGGQTLIWWMVGRQKRVQFELFHHTGPTQRPQPADWSPTDHGWVRIGLVVSDFDGVMQRLAAFGTPLLGGIARRGTSRRLAVRDPFVGILVEVWEDGPSVPGGVQPRVNNLDPALLYATSSVSDLRAARHFYEDLIGLSTAPLETLHTEADEAVWGLVDAKRVGFVIRAGDAFIEVVQYTSPAGRPKAKDYRFSDQGIMNVGLITRSNAMVQGVIDRMEEEGAAPTHLVVGEGVLGTYILQPEREIELFSCPEQLEPFLGFTPGPFLGVASADGNDPIRIVRR
jgi:catechol 2,3-dioxygenase-like lactoylglutathione lyase family enzyme